MRRATGPRGVSFWPTPVTRAHSIRRSPSQEPATSGAPVDLSANEGCEESETPSTEQRSEVRAPTEREVPAPRREKDQASRPGHLIGDAARDLRPGPSLALRTILVRSGKPWEAELATLRDADCEPDHVADDLPVAVDWILT